MSTAFNLERAKAGEPIVRVYGSGKNEPVLFIGVMSDGEIAVEFPDRPGEPFTYSQVELAMAPPKPVTIWVVTWWKNGRLERVESYRQESDARLVAAEPYPLGDSKITTVEVQP